ncbi:GPI-GlcNAc transferase complex, PIG-H component-domain-containing protein [Sparassis latifolia]|uniref:Phosphatidylinositol N-acetylglucosaminyltransferase subunit gpi15 n=1 Tax=Sparassis crispa TaxID=139825 RepID=A0A401GIL6_9APHY|nr:Phosphatidylinositol N-acetylglucosaminyltransferase subunit gpi15 [Sparassis crispa]GBE82026.1 Phosphatidylinositol N-acetylglucosaminyltransferase subunit gpi15 [Sparassis crispa]
MRRTSPLLDFPEFSLLECPGWREYRVENPRLVHTGAHTLRRILHWYWTDATLPLLAAILWPSVSKNRVAVVGLVSAVLIYLYTRCTQVLWESVVVLPSLGIQLETHQGLPSLPLFTSRRFIPLSSLQDFVINEGLRRWDIRYYLVAIQRSQNGVISLEVAYENLLPRFAVLFEVYHGVHETLLGDGSKQDEHENET